MGEQLKKTAHTTYVAKYHLVWIPKFQMPVLGRGVGKRLKEILAGTAKRYGFEIDTVEVEDDHVHLFVSFPPSVSISQAVKIFKGVSGKRLNEEFPDMEKRVWGAPVWARGFFASTVNDKTTAQQIRKYIMSQKRQQKQIKLL